MKCLILGGGGFLGSHLCEALLAQGHDVRILDRPNLARFKPFQHHATVEWIDGDFVNLKDVDSAVSGCDIVYHLVSTTLPRSSNENPVYDVETNVIGTLHLLESVRKHNVKKIIFVSSGGTVYGIPEEIPIKESHPTGPICSYGISKLAIEKYMSLFHLLHGIEYCVLRLSNPFGERQRVSAAQGAVTVFLHKALRNEVIEIWGDGTVTRDYFYVSDAVSALVRAMFYEGDNRLFNIGSGVGRSLNEILDAIDSLIGTPAKRVYMPARTFDVAINVLDISKAERLLNWKPQIQFAEGLSRTAQWLISDQIK
ncbi:MAG: NAD-dependent epimerase/dehydratase family protein [Gallionella sp.]|nr:NAD-dependent epimerase/dehydratase family protein [Gallionella sp.]